MDATLALRDIHDLPAPAWWPPAPGWWMVGVGVLAVGAVLLWRSRERRRRFARIAALFDDALAPATTPSEAVATMSELLRRAARRIDPAADRLQGDAWLALLDRGLEPPRFSTPAGRLLLEGAFRPHVDPEGVAALRRIARARFIAWMTAP